MVENIIERTFGADLVARFKESWSLKDFLKQYGPKMQIGKYPIVNTGSITFRRCRYGSTEKGWVYSYVSIRIAELTSEWVIENKNLLRVGKTEFGDYVLYLNEENKGWVDVEFPEKAKSQERHENVFEKLKVYGKKKITTKNLFNKPDEPWTPAYFNRKAMEQKSDAFDGDSDAYWNID